MLCVTLNIKPYPFHLSVLHEDTWGIAYEDGKCLILHTLIGKSSSHVTYLSPVTMSTYGWKQAFHQLFFLVCSSGEIIEKDFVFLKGLEGTSEGKQRQGIICSNIASMICEWRKSLRWVWKWSLHWTKLVVTIGTLLLGKCLVIVPWCK